MAAMLKDQPPLEGVWGSAATIQPSSGDSPTLLHKAQFQKQPCSCLTPVPVLERAYMHIYDNRLEQNNPIGTCGPFSSASCVVDSITVQYFDKPPFVIGATMLQPLPLSCFGPPVIFPAKGGCLKPGTTIYTSPFNLCNMKSFLVCGKPCYMKYALPLGPTLTVGGAEQFTQVLTHAVNQYHNTHGIPAKKRVQFSALDGKKVIQVAPAPVMEIER